MNGYIVLMDKSIDAMKKAIEFYQKKEFDLMRFWKNASLGYKEKALSLSMEEGL